MNIDLKAYGLDEELEQEAAEYNGLYIARVITQHRDLYKVVSRQGEITARVSGKFSYRAGSQIEFPAAGDWVLVDRTEGAVGDAIIHHVLHRKSVLTRQTAGTANERQVIAANIDTIFICMSLNADFNLRRVERYLTIAWDSMATPVIVLTKSDLCEDLQKKMEEISAVSIGVNLVACSSENEEGYEEIRKYIQPGKTVAFVGSSGVGKSTMINRLMGREVLATKTIRMDDDKGRHTTTHRELLLLPSGGVVIDTPGMRELQVDTGNLSRTFEDIGEIALGCKYNDCSHENEPGCMVRQAIAEGKLTEGRLESYRKLQREISYNGMNARQLENEKLSRMFGGKNELKQMRDFLKNKKGR